MRPRGRCASPSLGTPRSALLLVALSASAAVAQPVNIPAAVQIYSGARRERSRKPRAAMPCRSGPGSCRAPPTCACSTGRPRSPSPPARSRRGRPTVRSGRSSCSSTRRSPRTYTIQVGTPRTTTDRAFMPVTWDVPTRIFTLPAAYLATRYLLGAETTRPDRVPGVGSEAADRYSRIATVGTAACVRDDHYYDAITTTYQLYARTGTLRTWSMRAAGRFTIGAIRSICRVRHGHPRCSGGYLNNTRYTFPQGLVQDFFMFGDEEARSVSALVVDNFYMPHEAVGTTRRRTRGDSGPSARRRSHSSASWRTTRGPVTLTYLNRVRDRVTSLHRMQVDNGRRAWVHNLYDHDPSEGCAMSDYGSSPWMSGLLLEAIVKYHKLTGDPVARESILMAVDDLRARYLATGDYAGVSFVYLGCSAYVDGDAGPGQPDFARVRLRVQADRRPGVSNDRHDLFNTSVLNGVTADRTSTTTSSSAAAATFPRTCRAPSRFPRRLPRISESFAER